LEGGLMENLNYDIDKLIQELKVYKFEKSKNFHSKEKIFTISEIQGLNKIDTYNLNKILKCVRCLE
jgi:hypothetical protein